MPYRLRPPTWRLVRRSKVRRRPAPQLRRRKPNREPRRRFTLFCEGRKTEPAYFDAIRRKCPSTLISIKIHGGVGVPYTIARKAVTFAKQQGLAPQARRKMNSFEERDQVWAIFDRDEHPRFKEAVKYCERHRVGVARSDPCFELWLILHLQDYNRPCGRHNVQADLKKIRPEYDLHGSKTPNCDELVEMVIEAKKRAEKQLRDRKNEGSPYGNPSTTVGRLIGELF